MEEYIGKITQKQIIINKQNKFLDKLKKWSNNNSDNNNY